MRAVYRFILISLLGFSSLYARADVRLPAVIGNHMVLQQNTTVTLWGWCDPAERLAIIVDWDTTVYQAIGQNTARWTVQIKTPVTDNKPHRITIAGRNTVQLDDVLLGEVWVCGGQSNMEWSGARGIKQAIDKAPQANNPSIRFFYVPKAVAAAPQDDMQARWVVCTPETMLTFSAIGYFFGEKLQQQLNVPVGLINANWEGTNAEVWVPAEQVLSDSTLRRAFSYVSTDAPKWPIEPGVGYNAMIHPLTSFAVAGVIFYQGESNVNARMPDAYVKLFKQLIDSWRTNWQRDFPFYYVQIAPFTMYNQPFNAARLREAQTLCASHPKTGMVVIHDLVDNVKEIHPQNKKDVGLRLANYALADTYGQTGIAYKSPLYERMVVENASARLYFANADQGLESRGGAPREFMIAGADQVFYPAVAHIEGRTVVVSSKRVDKPVAVRFGYDNTSTPNVFNKEGLPLNLFRTDTWPFAN
jgi:sialate O-acetylesterase